MATLNKKNGVTTFTVSDEKLVGDYFQIIGTNGQDVITGSDKKTSSWAATGRT